MTQATTIDTPIRRATISEAMFARERQHSGRIRFFRRALPGIAILILAVLVGKTAFTSLTGVSIDLAGTTIQGGKLIMDGPHMSGFTSNNRPYELSALRAIQDITRTESVDLEGIAARVPIGMKDWAQIDAATGTLFRDSGKLAITSPTVIETTDGMKAHLQSAELLMASGDIRGTESVRIETGGSHVTAEQLTVTGGGAVMVFERNVKMLIEPSRVTTAQTTDDAANATE
jgi:lipopolysaccharide export system protein LptC